MRAGQPQKLQPDTHRSKASTAPQLSQVQVNSSLSLPDKGSPVTAGLSEHDEVTNAATILEFLAWGRRKEVTYATQLTPVEEPTTYFDDKLYGDNGVSSVVHEDSEEDISPEILQLLLPDQQLVTSLVDYHLESLLWYHGSFHGPSFRSQLNEFFGHYRGQIQQSDVDMQWVAVLFAVLCGSICCGSKSALSRWGFHQNEQELLSRKWHHAVVTCLNQARYMARLSIRSCEAIATLTICAHMLGFSNQQAVLLASAVRIAQSLELHRLDDTSLKTVDRETGRRVWTQLCSQDWFSIPFSECYLVNPIYSCTLQAVNCDDVTLEPLPDERPTVTSYCTYLHRIAALMPQLQDAITISNTSYTKYEQVMKFDKKMRTLASEERPGFLCNVPVASSWPKWVTWARSAAAISSAHKIIMIHRSFLTMSFTNSAFAFTRRTCIAASKTILKEMPRLATDDTPVLWIFHAFVVAAGITLGLDALHRDAHEPICFEHCLLIEDSVRLLKTAKNSKIASRGVRILSDLLALEKRTRLERSATSNNKRKADEVVGLQRTKRHHSIDMRDVVRDFQRGLSPVQSRKDAPVPATAVESVLPEAPMSTNSHETYDHPTFHGSYEDTIGDGFFSADETLANFHSDYMSHGNDAFGNLLTLAQTNGNS
ncbi:Agnestins biosynthesis cluster transcription factor AgnL11 [Pseudocercospora fuligena]|uniref:Agnestins biosynthesis cluster transcription factor AgnL11 n=1 Tax=Pseudocercospora fuligena TaxID=685502 RepID=A0A8H6RAS1_9PEZI|nr:Agnestins biosynthesis cluster transcription factor AgnL11 [Pseudocercospora fuligena]